MDEPLNPVAAKKLIQAILKTTDGGTPSKVAFPGHAQKEMAKDKLIVGDIINVLRGGVVEPGELEKGSWRYRVRTNKIVAVVCFRSEIELGIVTCWRIKK